MSTENVTPSAAPGAGEPAPHDSGTYGELPAEIRALIVNYEWDNMTRDEQRAWLIDALRSLLNPPALAALHAEEDEALLALAENVEHVEWYGPHERVEPTLEGRVAQFIRACSPERIRALITARRAAEARAETLQRALNERYGKWVDERERAQRGAQDTAALREAAAFLVEDDTDVAGFLRLEAGQPYTTAQHGHFMRSVADRLDALRAALPNGGTPEGALK